MLLKWLTRGTCREKYEFVLGQVMCDTNAAGCLELLLHLYFSRDLRPIVLGARRNTKQQKWARILDWRIVVNAKVKGRQSNTLYHIIVERRGKTAQPKNEIS